jgi:hypothetical protein
MYSEDTPFHYESPFRESSHYKTINEEMNDNSSSSSKSIIAPEHAIEERIPFSKVVDFVILNEFVIPGKKSRRAIS